MVMSDILKRFIWVSVYAIAMAFLEAVVVVYLRQLLHFRDVIVDMGPYAPIEAWREAATIVMLAAVGWLAGHNKMDRIAYGMFAFGLWDIWYYIWLWVLVRWPKTILDWDTLFLIPLPWRGPVLSPVMIAALICVIAVLVVIRVDKQETPEITFRQVILIIGGALLALYVFMENAIRLWMRGRTDWSSIQQEVFNWPLFLVAFLLMAVPSIMACWPTQRDLKGFRTKASPR
jgi:hypothetical protein